MSEVLVLSLVSRKQASLHLIVPSMGNLQLIQNLTRQILSKHPIKFKCTESTKQVVDRLVVDVEHIPQTWGKEVILEDIGDVIRHILKQLSCATKKCSHPDMPYLVVLPIKVWRTQTPILVHYLWMLG
jgi:hypothetical protein